MDARSPDGIICYNNRGDDRHFDCAMASMTMTDPTPGPEPTLAELLDELMLATEYSCFIDADKWVPKALEIRATILARFGGRDVSTMIDKTYTEWQRGENKMCIELALMIKAALAQTETKAGRDPFSHSPGQD